MTAYFFVMRRNGISIYQDTLVVDLRKSGHPVMGHAQKIIPVDDLNLVICGSGSLFFHELARDTIRINAVDSLEEAADAVAHFVDLYQRRTRDIADIDVHIYLLGVDPATGMSNGYAIRTKEGHQPTRIKPGYCCNNVRFHMGKQDGFSILPSHDEIMAHFGALPAQFCRESGIGGDIVCASVTQSGIELEKVGDFPMW